MVMSESKMVNEEKREKVKEEIEKMGYVYKR